MKYSREDKDNILKEILEAIKNYKLINSFEPNVIYLNNELCIALALFEGLSTNLGMGTTESLFGLKIYRSWNLEGKPFKLYRFKEQNNFQKIQSCTTKQEMADILSKICLNYTKDEIVIWLNSEFK